jgi:hypothetical protein
MVYLKEFNENTNGPLHIQDWCIDELKKFDKNIFSLRQHFCNNCEELWPTTEETCKQCRQNSMRFSKVIDFYTKSF